MTISIEVASMALSWGLEPVYDTLAYAAFSMVTAWAGHLVLSRHPRHVVGWLLMANALVNAVGADAAQGWALRAATESWPGGDVAALVATSSWIPSGFGWTLTFLVFPTGHLLGRRWLIVPRLAALGLVLALPGWSLSPDRREEFPEGRNPFAVDVLAHDLLLATGMSLVAGCLIVSGASLVVRLRRASGVERQQVRLFVYAAAATAVCLPLSFVFWYSVPAVRILPALALCALPVAACVAILRHRLFDVDVLIDRSLVYLALTVVLSGSFVGVTLLVGTTLGRDSVWGTAAATLLVAVAFQPLRSRLQTAVDKVFHRSRFRAVRRAEDFLEDLRAGRVAPEELHVLLRDLLGDPGLDLLVLLPQSQELVDTAGRPWVPPASVPPGVVQIPVRRGETLLGLVLLHDPPRGHPAQEDPALAQSVMDATGLAVEILRLHVEVGRQLAEVEASRARIVTAGLEERRRIERDLHDGAQQRLVSIGLALRHAQHQLHVGSTGAGEPVSATLDGAVVQVTATIAELRELARGLPPAQLDRGLAPAFLDLARRAPVPVRVSAPDRRFEPALEAAAYFIGCEALTNAVKHSHATLVSLDADHHDGALVVTVADDGIGGAAAAGGSGLVGLADRVAALGGVLTMESIPGNGTTVRAVLPCGS